MNEKTCSFPKTQVKLGEQHTVETNAGPVARPDGRTAGVASHVDTVVEFRVIDDYLMRVDADDWT